MDALTVIFRSGDNVVSRNISTVVRTAVLEVPDPPARVLSDWHREIFSELGLEAGDIEPMPFGRARLRWPQLRDCIEAVRQWMHAQDLAAALETSELALMASLGTPYHHDGGQYGDKVFCNLFLGEDSGVELHLPMAGQRIALVRGTAVIFDPSQPHAIIARGAAGFDAAGFAPECRQAQVFLTWELPAEHEAVRGALGIRFGTPVDPQLQEACVLRGGVPMRLCPETGDWLAA